VNIWFPANELDKYSFRTNQQTKDRETETVGPKKLIHEVGTLLLLQLAEFRRSQTPLPRRGSIPDQFMFDMWWTRPGLLVAHEKYDEKRWGNGCSCIDGGGKMTHCNEGHVITHINKPYNPSRLVNSTQIH
jgi:hypothetical protein